MLTWINPLGHGLNVRCLRPTSSGLYRLGRYNRYLNSLTFNAFQSFFRNRGSSSGLIQAMSQNVPMEVKRHLRICRPLILLKHPFSQYFRNTIASGWSFLMVRRTCGILQCRASLYVLRL